MAYISGSQGFFSCDPKNRTTGIGPRLGRLCHNPGINGKSCKCWTPLLMKKSLTKGLPQQGNLSAHPWFMLIPMIYGCSVKADYLPRSYIHNVQWHNNNYFGKSEGKNRYYSIRAIFLTFGIWYKGARNESNMAWSCYHIQHPQNNTPIKSLIADVEMKEGSPKFR